MRIGVPLHKKERMKSLLFVFISLISLQLSAQEIIESCKFGQPLVEALQEDYTPNNPLGYGDGRDILYSEIDNNGLELSGIYTDFTVTLDPNADPSVSAFQGGSGINAEHVYPQSLGAGDEPARSDLHNIFPSKVNVNSARGSCPFGEIVDSDTDIWFYLNLQSSSTPTSEIDNYSEKDEEDCVFEPREEVKGDIARAMFYFYTIYQSIADSKNPNFFHNQKAILYEWHLADLPDDRELQRNEKIAAEQGNLNPFIADTSLVRRAYFSEDASYPEGDPNCLTTSIEELEVNEWVTISSYFVQDELEVFSSKSQGAILLFDMYGQLMTRESLEREKRLIVSDLPMGVYILQVYSGNKVKAFRFVKK